MNDNVTTENKSNKKKYVIWGISGLILLISIYGFLLYRKYYPSTDDAYLNAHIVNMAAQVSGPIKQIYVKNNQAVKANQNLFLIDPTPFKVAAHQAQAELELSRQQLAADEDAIKTAEAQVQQAQAQLTVDTRNAQRILTLVAKGQESKSSGDTAQGQKEVSQATLAASQSELAQSKQNLLAQQAKVAAQREVLKQALLNLSYTLITAPADGQLVNFNLRSGYMVSANQPLFALVEDQSWWVDANFKETDLARIKPGMSAKIEIDSYPGVTFNGIIDSVSRGSGAAFSIMPAENATGNWVKVTQRFEVKVLLPEQNPKYPYRVGASSSVRVDTLSETTQ